MKLVFSRQIFEKFSNVNLIKICPVEADLFYSDGQTDVTKLIFVLRNFLNAPWNLSKRRRLENVADIQPESHSVLNSITTRSMHRCFQQWERCGTRCINSDGATWHALSLVLSVCLQLLRNSSPEILHGTLHYHKYQKINK